MRRQSFVETNPAGRRRRRDRDGGGMIPHEGARPRLLPWRGRGRASTAISIGLVYFSWAILPMSSTRASSRGAADLGVGTGPAARRGNHPPPVQAVALCILHLARTLRRLQLLFLDKPTAMLDLARRETKRAAVDAWARVPLCWDSGEV
jgi:hypothetical protein